MTTQQAPVQFYVQSGNAHPAGMVPMASGQAPTTGGGAATGGGATAPRDERTLLQKLQMLPAQPYAFGSEARAKAEATKAEGMKRAFGGGFVLGVIAQAVVEYQKG